MTLCPYIQVIGNDEFLAEGLHLKSHNALYTYAGPRCRWYKFEIV